MLHHTVVESSPGNPAIVTLPATAGVSYSIDWIGYSYRGLPSSAKELSIKVDGVKILANDIANSGLGIIERQFTCDIGQSMEVKLEAAFMGFVELKSKLTVIWQDFS